MKNALILGLAIAAISPFAAFAADDQYPASNFQPSVVYIDEQLAGQSAPAANTQNSGDHSGCADKSAQSSAAATPVEVDPAHPAYNFQPKLVYP